jgi:primosomal protein N' (replication factor Y)
MDDQLYAEVLVDVGARKINQVFHYAIPAGLAGKIKAGSRVLVPFGRRSAGGFVTGFSGLPQGLEDGSKIKSISKLVDEGPVYTPAQMELAGWLAGFYLCPLVSALNAIIWPRIQGVDAKRVRRLYPAENCSPELLDRLTEKRRKVWEAAVKQPGLSRKDLAGAAGTSVGVVDGLVSGGLLFYSSIEVRRDPYPEEVSVPGKDIVLTPQQSTALREINTAVDRSAREVFLLFGVTSSGKTEVYLRAIEHTLSLGRQAVAMVPDISLTPQMVSSFKGKFGNRVAVLHSRLSDGERYDEWRRIASGAAPVVLGARSASFAPLDNPGLIILDEEQENSYKQEETPRYHARDVALWLAGRFNAVAVFGSATPALESYYRAGPGGPYRLLTLDGRVGSRPLPAVQVIDMREEIKKGNSGLFSHTLVEAVQTRLARKEQVILFLNRRGYATFVVCRDCGLVMKCPHCDISLTYHTGGALRCHYCNHVKAAPDACPDCQSRHLGYFGTGTQRIEEEVARVFPGARVLRMDSDTTSRKGSHGRILKTFREGGADILVGTQMVAKGLDMPGVTLVGVVSADLTLHMPDFRSAERTFQLIAQVAGRAGRSSLGGEVLVQTFSPEHYSIAYASRHDYLNFYKYEMKLRKALQYPPFTRLARILFTGVDEGAVKKAAERLASILQQMAGQGAYRDIEVMGPAAAPLPRIKDRHRHHLVIKSKSGKMLRELLQNLLDRIELKSRSGVGTTVDIDPQNLM